MADIHTEAILSALAPADADLLAKRGEYMNAPALGSTRHHLVGSMQVNVTGVSCRSNHSHGALGSAGTFHTDNGDDYCALSALTNLSDIGSDFGHGFFLLLEYGIAFEWLPLLTVLASGRGLHVSSPPQLRPNATNRQPQPWELRLLVISYPSRNVLIRAVPTILSSSPSGPLVLPPGALESFSSTTRPHRSWASDGGNIQNEQNHLVFLARELLTWAQQVFSQVPGFSNHGRIDAEQFFRSFQVLASSVPGTPGNSATSPALWVPAISEQNLAWNNGPWREGSTGFNPAPPPDLSALATRSKSGFILLAAKDDGVVPSQASKANQTKGKQGENKRTRMTHCQKALGR